uniref:N-6 DNA methylase n=1 Tax=Psychrobacter sp. TaxID=56811 RepID=UPI0015983BB9|nr:N-6 DNA methylase [Psychrobacter sp.]QJS05557.1 modification methylase [Psychrobacter sp.]
MKFKSEQTADKLRGGYYTPQNLADYIVKWTIQDSSNSVLEPSCGDGVFIQALNNANIDKKIKISAFEIVDEEAEKSKLRSVALGFKNTNIVNSDFLSWANEEVFEGSTKFSCVVGNPPFIRYQFLEPFFQKQAELIFKRLELKFTKHTNAWVSFVLASIEALENGGRLGMIIPSEIIHVTHARPLREYLEKTCTKILIIDPKEIWFEGTLQGAVMIFAEKKSSPNSVFQGIGIYQVQGLDFLNIDPDELFINTNKIASETASGKWTKGLLTNEEWLLVSRATSHKDVHQFTDIARVDVGIVTGANAFFLVNDDTVEKYNLHQYSYPMFGRSQHCKGVIYDDQQHKSNKDNGLPTNFLYITEDFDDLSEDVQEYIEVGEGQELHNRYKCRIRKPWYKVPSVYTTNLGMLKRCHEFPRLIFNEIEAYTTDTAYRIRTELSPELLTYCFINPLTAITAELEGRSYGGGVLELVPSEIEKIYIPLPESLDYDISELNKNIKAGNLESVLKSQGDKIFKALGFTQEEGDKLFNIWQKLKGRRLRTS